LRRAWRLTFGSALGCALCCAFGLAFLPGVVQAQRATPTAVPVAAPVAIPTVLPATHTVQAGETLSEIAKQYGFTLSQMMRVNGIPNPNAIYTGQELRFPIIDRPPGVIIHVVEPGEALSRIAQRYAVDLRSLMRANDITNPDGIVTGQELVIPGPEDEGAATATTEATPAATVSSPTATAVEEPTAEPTPTPAPMNTPMNTPTAAPMAARPGGPATHTVRPGETASEIAKQYGVPLTDLLRVNGIANANLIRSGTELTIPAAAPGTTPTPTMSGEPEVVMRDEPPAQADTVPAEGDSTSSAPEVGDLTPAAPTPPEAPTSVPLSERPAASLNRTYTVVSGDSPQRIALRLGLDEDALRGLNNLAPGDGLRAGATLLLPATDRELRVVSAEQQVVVAPGDSLSTIARSVGVTLGELMTANRISNPNLISVGQSLTVPGQEQRGNGPPPRVGPARSGYYYYTVRPGDTLGELAQDFSSTKLALMEYNNLTDESVVYTGMELRVPFGAPPVPVRQPPVPISGSKFLVSLSRQQCWVFSGSDVAYAWNCSTGHGQWRTRTGNFAVQSKIENAKSNVWRLDMPWWLGIYDVGAVENGIHGLPVSWKTGRKIWTELIGQPATFGCAMLGDENAETLFNLAYIGMPVHIIQ
jgi:LysM repeat protein